MTSGWRQFVISCSALTFAVAVSSAAFATPVTYEGITFPNGDSSFADQVVSFTQGSFLGSGVTCGNNAPPNNDTSRALGAPQITNDVIADTCNSAVSLGENGVLVLHFDNPLVDVAGLDIYIFETGVVAEAMGVEISQDNLNWISVGQAIRGVNATSLGIDIGPFVVPGAQFGYVRITDLNTRGLQNPPSGRDAQTNGADINAVGLGGPISVAEVPEPATWLLVGTGAGALALRRRARK